MAALQLNTSALVVRATAKGHCVERAAATARHGLAGEENAAKSHTCASRAKTAQKIPTRRTLSKEDKSQSSHKKKGRAQASDSEH